MKKLLSLILVFIMLAMTVSTAFAENHEDVITQASDTDTKEQTTENWWCVILYQFCDYLHCKSQDIFFFDHLFEGVADIQKEALEIMENNGGLDIWHPIDRFDNMTDEEAYAQMQDFLFKIEHALLKVEHFNALYEACYMEKNINGYYSKEDWDNFTKALETAKKIYEGEKDGKYSEEDMKKQMDNAYITNAYFDLRNALKSLCLTNTNYMDLNRDTAVTLKDVVKVQRYIANLEHLNISERIVVSRSRCGDIDLNVVTYMQRYIAQIEKLPLSTPLSFIMDDWVESAFFNRTMRTYPQNYLAEIFEKVLKDLGFESVDEIPLITQSSDAETDIDTDTNTDTDTEERPARKHWCFFLDDFCHYVLRNDDCIIFSDHIYNDDVYNMIRDFIGDEGKYTIGGAPHSPTAYPLIYKMSDEEAYFKMQEFIFLIEHAEIKSFYFNYLYEVCREETNDNGYYSKEVWDEFTSALKEAKEIYDRETDGKYSEDDLKKQIENDYINNAYFRLRDAFKSLCLTNTNYMDLDRDTAVTLNDVVKVQRYIARLEHLNISEKLVVSKSYYGDITMSVVTDMQKNIAHILELDYDPLILIMQDSAIENILINKDRYYTDSIYPGNFLKEALEEITAWHAHIDLPTYD